MSMLKLNNIEVTYLNVIRVLHGVSLNVDDGSIIALLGANGAGKSTTLKAISGLLHVEEGEVTDGSIAWNDDRIDRKSAEEIGKLGIIQALEGRRVFGHLTAEENLAVGAYQRRDRVGLVVFLKDRANLVLPPTNSVQLAQRALADIPVGGKTPLSAGLFLAHEVIKREINLHPDVMPLMIVLTDGAGNVAMWDLPPQEEAHSLADQIARSDIRSVVINMEHQAFDQGLAQALADHLKAPCYTLSELKAENLYRAVRAEMETGAAGQGK